MAEKQLEKLAAQKDSINAKKFADAGRVDPVKTYKYDPTKARMVNSKQ